MMLRLSSTRSRLAELAPAARRLRHVAQQPGQATSHDLELLMRAHGVAEVKAWAALDCLAASDVSPPVAWAFAMEHDGTELADALLAGPSVRGARAHVDGAPGLA